MLEVALEDAANTTFVGGFEMDATLFQQISELPGNDRCADCGSFDTEWASVSFGILICATCSGEHRALGTHISRVRSIKMDSWTQEHTNLMQAGGNRKCQNYLAQHGCMQNHGVEGEADINIEERYSSQVAQEYKEFLKDSSNRRIDIPLKALDNTMTQCAGDSADCVVEIPGLRRTLERLDSTASTHNESDIDSFCLNSEDGTEIEEPTVTEHIVGDVVTEISTALESWFSKSTAQPARKERTSPFSSASTPTITYMGRTFKADGSDDGLRSLSNHESRLHRKRLCSLAPLANMAQQEDLIARDSVSSNWISSIPTNHFSTAKKTESFDADDFRSQGRITRYGSLRRKLSYTADDILSIAKNDNEFARLKEGLQRKGAVTNELLKQRLHAFVAKSKTRVLSRSETTINCHDRQPVRSKSEDLTILRAHTIRSSLANRR